MQTNVPYKEFVEKLIPEQFKGSQKLNGVLDVMYAQFDSLAAMLQELLRRYDIDSVEGVMLDDIGTMVGVKRIYGEPDTDYRIRLKRGSMYGSIPSIEGTRELIKSITGSDKVGLYPCYPAGYCVVVETGGDKLKGSLEYMSASGISADLSTFLCIEGDTSTYICTEDYNMPIVISP